MENVQRIYDHAEDHHEEINLYILGEAGEEEEVEKEPAMGESHEATSVKEARSEGCVLAGLRLARLHAGAARLDGARRRASSASSSSSSTAPTAAARA